MSFMFNPYPYDDPKAVNHIPAGPELTDLIAKNAVASAKKLAKEAIALAKSNGRCIVGLEGYLSAPLEQFSGLVALTLAQEGAIAHVRTVEHLLLDSGTLYQKLLPYLPEDRVTDPVLLYGTLYEGDYESIMDAGRIAEMAASLADFRKNGSGVLIVYGQGVLIDALRPCFDLKLYMDVTQKRTILNVKAGACGNLGSTLRMPVNQVIRRSYYVDFEIAARLRGRLLCNDLVDYYLTGDYAEKVQMMPVSAMKALFGQMITYPLRCRPVYIEGVWGGFYLKRHRALPPEMKNCAWVFDLIPMEVSIAADLGCTLVEFPFYCFVQLVGPALMGQKVSEKFHNHFPIRFNYDDTFHSSGNMSIQVHPDADYIRANGEFGRQDESYYMVVTGQEAKTYCGFREDADAEEFIALAKRAESTGEGFDHDKYVYAHPSVAGQQFMLPAGTIHSSGRNQVILEIGSLTIGSYTYKMYDYMRKDLDGNLRPIHTHHGDKVLRRDFTENWVKDNLIPTPRTVREGDGFEEMIVGQHDLLYFSLRHVKFWEHYTDETTDRFHVLVLVDGERCLIRSLTDPTRFFRQDFLDMVIVPAGFGPYEVINEGVGKVTMHKTLLKDGYEND